MAQGPMAVPADRLEELVGMTNRVFRGGGGDMGREYPLVFDPRALDGMRVMMEDDRVVSHVGVCIRDAVLLGVPIRVASIGAVSTDPEYRGRGFAGALMEDSIALARERGATLMLISGDRALYRRIGGSRPGGFASIEIAEAELPRGYALEKATEDDAAELAALYQREPVRFIRSADDWRGLLRAGMLMNAGADCWIVRDADEPLGYVAVQRPPSHSQGEARPRVMEYAGSREAVWRAMKALAGTYGASSIRIHLMPGEVDLLGRARREEALIHAGGFTGTVKILDVAAFLNQVRPLWVERVGEDALNALALEADRDSLAFTVGGQRIRLEGADVTAAFFEPEAGRSDATPLTGLPPLPLLWYGYNYV